MQRQPALGRESGSLDGSAEGFAGVAMAVGLAAAGAEHEVVAGSVGPSVVVRAQQVGDGIGEDDFPLGSGGLEPFRVSVASELLFDPDDRQIEVDVSPAQPERFTDPEPRVGEELEQRPVRTCVLEELGEVCTLKNRGAFGLPARFLARFESSDRVLTEPPSPKRVPAHLVQRNQSHLGGCRR